MRVNSRGRVRHGYVLAVTLVLLLLAAPSLAGITFEKTYGRLEIDGGHSVDQTSDGGYIVAGYVDWTSGDTLANLYLIRTDSLGDTLWTRTYGSDSVEFVGHSVRHTYDGGYFIVGYVEPGIHGASDIPVWKFGPDGDLEWEKVFGNPLQECGYVGQQTTDGGYMIMGVSTTIQPWQAYLIKTDSLGDTLWSSMLGFPYSTAGRSGEQTEDGGYIVTGDAFLDPVYGMLLMKASSTGWPEWQKYYDLTPMRDSPRSVGQTTDGGYIVAGYSWDWHLENSQIYLLKTDEWGEEVWMRTYERGMFADEGHSVCQTYDGGYVIAGCTAPFAPENKDVYVIKTDSLGVVLWDTVFGTLGPDEGRSIQQTADSGYIVAGSATPQVGKRSEVYLVKLDKGGHVIGRRDGAVASIDEPADTVFTETWCEVIATVYSYSNVIDSVYAVARVDAYADTVRGIWLCPGESRQVHFGNWFVPPVDSTTYMMTVCVYAQDDIDTTNDSMEKEIFAYNPTGVEEGLDPPSAQDFRLCQNKPNPFHRSTVIQYSLATQCDVTLSVYDVTGNLVDKLVDGRQGAGVFQARWNPQGCADGIYFCRLMAGNLTDTRKMVLVR